LITGGSSWPKEREIQKKKKKWLKNLKLKILLNLTPIIGFAQN
jgi:hypothetical protein